MPSGSIRCLSGTEGALYDHGYLGCMYIVDLVSALA